MMHHSKTKRVPTTFRERSTFMAEEILLHASSCCPDPPTINTTSHSTSSPHTHTHSLPFLSPRVMANAASFPASLLLSRSPRLGKSNCRVAAATANPTEALRRAPNGKEALVVKEEEKDGVPRPMEIGGLPVLYDDGYGNVSVKDYMDAARQFRKTDGGPPRWFCPVECGEPVKGSPVLFFLPGIDGVGMGLILHHRSLGKVFEVRCLHVPVDDRTPFEGLVKFVEHSVKYEQTVCPNRPIYLVGDSLGACLALAVAARNPTIDLVLVLANPASSFDKSQLQPLLPVLEALPSDLHITVPYLLSFIMGDPVKMAMASVEDGLPPQQTLDELSKSLTSLLPCLSDLADIIPRETLLWKLKLLKSAASYTNSRLHAIEAEVLILASGRDSLLPSGDEADRLWASLKNCKVRYFKDSGHTLLLEGDINLLSFIKATRMYRRSGRYDFLKDYLPPTISEFRKAFEEDNRWFRLATNPVLLSTLSDGTIVRGLSGVPNEGPVLLVGYHMLLGLELSALYEAFLREKNVILRGIAHPVLFSKKLETSRTEFSFFDKINLFGGVPVSAANMYRLFSRKSFVLLYPGGAREALHLKGEEYKLFWPDQPEFVRMAARFQATIVPFGVVGEDDIAELVLDYNDLMRIPPYRNMVEEYNTDDTVKLRTDVQGEVSNQELFFPGVLPKIPGRLYYLFGKPIETHGMKDVLRDRNAANEHYLHVKSEVEGLMSYLKKKREEDPYRSVFQRAIYQVSRGSTPHVPAFDP